MAELSGGGHVTDGVCKADLEFDISEVTMTIFGREVGLRHRQDVVVIATCQSAWI